MDPRIGLLLLNFGGPETLNDVRPFLYNLFADPEVIRLPLLIREPLARLVAAVRERRSREYYRRIGGGSPIRRITEQQGNALKAALGKRGFDLRIYIGMQCWHPFIEVAVKEIIHDCVSHLVVLPLFPQFSLTTTGACLAKLNQAFDRHTLRTTPERVVIDHWYDHTHYIQSVADMIRASLHEYPSNIMAKVHLLFSAHSIPQKYIERGDPYARETMSTVECILDRLGRRNPHHLAFQSRLGPIRWLRPYTDEVIGQLGRQGLKHLLVIPISFVSEHVETLYEIDQLYQDVARRAGITDFRRVPAPNCNAGFIEALASLVEESLASFHLKPAASSRSH